MKVRPIRSALQSSSRMRYSNHSVSTIYSISGIRPLKIQTRYMDGLHDCAQSVYSKSNTWRFKETWPVMKILYKAILSTMDWPFHQLHRLFLQETDAVGCHMISKITMHKWQTYLLRQMGLKHGELHISLECQAPSSWILIHVSKRIETSNITPPVRWFLVHLPNAITIIAHAWLQISQIIQHCTCIFQSPHTSTCGLPWK